MKKFFIAFFLIFFASFPLISQAIPLPDFLNLGDSDPNIIIGRIARFAAGIAGSLALIMFIWGGTEWIFSAGKSDKIDKGRNAMIWSFVGWMVVLFSWAMVSYLLNIFGK